MGIVLSPSLPQRQTPFFLDSRRITIHVSSYSVACFNTTFSLHCILLPSLFRGFSHRFTSWNLDGFVRSWWEGF